MKKSSLIFLLISCLIVLALGCGTENDIFGSVDNLPNSGVAPYTKVDLDPIAEMVQPFVLIPSDSEQEFKEPTVIYHDNQFQMWVELATFLGSTLGSPHISSEIFHFTSPDGFTWQVANDGKPVLTADLDWEKGSVGGPAVVRDQGRYHLWYAGGDGRGIGYAHSNDGDNWERQSSEPVLVADQDWEQNLVHAPCVIIEDGAYHMWYSAGDAGVGFGVATGKAIGYAGSSDGLSWIKRDAKGSAGAGPIAPVLVADQEWEATLPALPEQGYVSSPTVLVDQTPERKIFKMWYTGNVPGALFTDDASVGYAGSLDGLTWEKALPPVNPVLIEIFPLEFGGITDFLLYDEAQPSILRRGDLYMMYFVQLDPLGFIDGGLRGVSLATNPPLTLN